MALFFKRIRSYRRRSLQLLKEHLVLSLALGLSAVVFFTSLVFHFAEGNPEDTAIWRSIVYVVSGLDVEPPQSAAGQIAAVLVLTSGVVFISIMTGYAASFFSRLLLYAHSITPKPARRVFQNHAIIFGWGAKTKAILRELDADYSEQGLPIDDFVVIGKNDFLGKGQEAIYHNVYSVRGSATDTDVLKRADLMPHRGKGAKVAAVLADPTLSEEEADRHSLLTILAVEHLYPEVISLAEVMLEKNKEHFENAYADHVFLPRQYGRYLLARTCEFPGTALYVDELLSLAEAEMPVGTEEHAAPISIYVRSAAQLGVAGKSLTEATTEYYGNKQGIIVGTLSKGKCQLSPDGDLLAQPLLQPHDRLLVIATPEQI
jgi:voltage-gated potassium channel